MSRFLSVACVVALLFSFVVGCGGGDGFDRVPISGTVTCEGVDAPNGSVLGTIAATGTEAPNISWPLEGGKFSIPADQGPIAGSYKFEISIVTGEAAEGESPEGETETGPEVVYQKTIEIPAGGSDSLTIELTAADKVSDEM